MAKMVASMTAQGSRLYAFLQNPRSDTFFANLVPLLDEFTVSITGSIYIMFPCNA